MPNIAAPWPNVCRQAERQAQAAIAKLNHVLSRVSGGQNMPASEADWKAISLAAANALDVVGDLHNTTFTAWSFHRDGFLDEYDQRIGGVPK